jgi:pyrroloquinoline-quinone synthase
MQDLVDSALADTDAYNNPYFTALRDGSFAKEDFVETQIQFFYAVVFFSRPMAVVAAKIPSAEMRVEVMRNVWEEHGEGDPMAMHGATFLELLRRLAGIDLDEIDHRVLWPELRAFNTALIGCATMDDWEVGTACFGIIERMFVDFSSWIGKAIIDHGWLSEDQLVHYKFHKEIDIKHSADFFSVLEHSGEMDERTRYCVDQGLRMGAYLFDQLYAGMFRARKRRLRTSVQRVQTNFYRG